MWELIRANRRRSIILVIIMLFVMLALGFLIGSALAPVLGETSPTRLYLGERQLPYDPMGGLIGMAVAAAIWAVQSVVAYFSGGRMLLRVSGAREIEKSDHPQLFNVVEEMKIASSLPAMPRIFVIDSDAMNAFATGRDPDHAAVAVTTGLLERLNRDQLQGVIAHEISHITNRDVLFMMMLGIMAGTIVILAESFWRLAFYGGIGRSRGSRRSGEGGGGGLYYVVILVVALVAVIVAPLIARLIYMAASRRREYLADAGAAVFTRYPEGLASALEALERDHRTLPQANRATAGMYIINPLTRTMRGWGSTHPPTSERIRILRSIAGGVSYQDYQHAWRQAGGKAEMPAEALAQQRQPLREASPDAIAQQRAQQDPRRKHRDLDDLVRKLNDFVFLPCVCGMRIKLPPEFSGTSTNCPRCGRHLEVPIAHLATLTAAAAATRGDAVTAALTGAAASSPAGVRTAKRRQPPAQVQRQEPPLQVARRPEEWQTIQCTCGATKNLGPSFDLPQTRCQRCGREIALVAE